MMWTFGVILSLLLGLIQSILGLGTAWLLKLVTDMVTGAQATLTFQDFSLIAGVCYAAYLLIYWLSKKVNAKAMTQIRIRIKEKLSKGLIWQTEKEYRKTQLGQAVSRFGYQVDSLENLYYAPLFQLIKNGVTAVVYLGAAICLQWQMTAMSLVVFTVFLLSTNRMQKKLNKDQAEIIERSERENSALVTMIDGFHTARDCGQENFFVKRYQESAEQLAWTNFRYEFLYDILSSISVNLEPVMTLLVILLGGMMLQSGAHGLTVGGILGMTQLIASVLGPIGEFGPGLNQMRSAAPLRKAFRDYEEAGLAGRMVWEERGTALPELERITLRDISFAYEEEHITPAGCSAVPSQDTPQASQVASQASQVAPQGPGNLSREAPQDATDSRYETVLEHLNLELKAGGKYAIVGESGSGKTTLLKLIMKLLTPSGGTVLWNDIPYREIGKACLLSNIAYVTQTPMVFSKSLKDNILAGREEDADKLAAVIRRSKLDVMGAG